MVSGFAIKLTFLFPPLLIGMNRKSCRTTQKTRTVLFSFLSLTRNRPAGTFHTDGSPKIPLRKRRFATKPRLFDEFAAQKHRANARQLLFIPYFPDSVKPFFKKI